MRWSRLHGDMQGFQSKEVGVRPVKTWSDKTSSEIPCRVSRNELPELGVIPANKPANNGEALLVCDASRTSWRERVIPWEVDTHRV